MKKLSITPLAEPEELEAIHKATGGRIRFPVDNGLPKAQGSLNFFPVISGLRDHGNRTPVPSCSDRIIVMQVKGSNTVIIKRGGTIYLIRRNPLCDSCLAPFLPLQP